MNAHCPSLSSRVLLGLALSLLQAGRLSHAQVEEQQLKAAYVYNFAKFAEWPPEAFATAGDSIRICVLNDERFRSQLEQVIKDKRIAGRVVLAVEVNNVEQARHCHVLFINSSHNGEAFRLFESLRGASVLTVGETGTFVDRGGIVGFVTENGQVHFQVNHKAATESGIRLSSRLLSVARRVVK